MNRPFNEDALRRLGLEGYARGLHSSVHLRDDGTPHGFVAAEPNRPFDAWVDVQFVGALFLPANAAAAASIGVEAAVLAGNPNVVRMTVDRASDREPPRFATTSEAGLAVISEDPMTAFVDLDSAEILAVDLRDGSALLVWSSERVLEFELLTRQPVRVGLNVPLVAPEELWVGDCHDAWLAQQVRQHAAIDDPWHHIVAAAMYARFFEPRPEQLAQVLADLRAGRPSPAVGRVREWMQAFSPAQWAMIRRYALAESECLRGTMEVLAEEGGSYDAVWLDELIEVCRCRDDLQSVWLVLPPFADDPLQTSLREVDRAGVLLVESIPKEVELADEQLWRASLRTPARWWARYAVPPESDAQGA